MQLLRGDAYHTQCKDIFCDGMMHTHRSIDMHYVFIEGPYAMVHDIFGDILTIRKKVCFFLPIHHCAGGTNLQPNVHLGRIILSLWFSFWLHKKFKFWNNLKDAWITFYEIRGSVCCKSVQISITKRKDWSTVVKFQIAISDVHQII